MEELKLSFRDFFLRYQISLCLSFFTSILMTFLLFYSLQKLNLISEKYDDTTISTFIKQIEAQGFDENTGVPYIKIENGTIIQSNMKNDRLHTFYDSFLSGKKITNYQLKKAVYQNREFIIGFPTNYVYVSETLQKDLKEPILNAIGFFMIFVIISYWYFTKNLYKRIEKDFHNLLSITISEDLTKDGDYTILEISKIANALIKTKHQLIQSKENTQNHNTTMKTQIMSLSHDLKVPLTIIKGNVELVSKQPNSQKNDKRLLSIIRQIDRIDKYLTDISTFIKVQSFEQITTLQISCDKLFTIVYQYVSDYCTIRNRKLVFTSYIGYPESCDIHLDYFIRAINNILDNAIDYSENDISVVFQVQHDSLYIDIIDYGIGFSPEELRKCKELFYTKNISRTGSHHYGIGLSFADKIIKLHKGEIHIHSIKYSFSRVTITLPINSDEVK